MAQADPPESIAAFTRGDAQRAQGLTNALRVLRDSETNADVRYALEKVLDGRMTFREFVRSSQGTSVIHRGKQAVETAWEEMTDEQKAKFRGLDEDEAVPGDEL